MSRFGTLVTIASGANQGRMDLQSARSGSDTRHAAQAGIKDAHALRSVASKGNTSRRGARRLE